MENLYVVLETTVNCVTGVWSVHVACIESTQEQAETAIKNLEKAADKWNKGRSFVNYRYECVLGPYSNKTEAC